MATKRKSTPIERFLALSDADKALEIALLEKFDQENPGPISSSDRLPGRAMSPAERRLWAKAKQKTGRGRPTLGLGSKMIPVSIERGLLREADAFAKVHKLKRSQLVAEALRLIMQLGKAS